VARALGCDVALAGAGWVGSPAGIAGELVLSADVIVAALGGWADALAGRAVRCAPGELSWSGCPQPLINNTISTSQQ
jgi:hypothetical protein